MKRQRPAHDAREVVTIGGCEFLRNGGTWLFWCGCGDIVSLSDVTDDQCANCNAAVSYPTVAPTERAVSGGA